MLVLLDTADGGVLPRRPRPADRVRARLRSHRLTRDLAAGGSPDATMLHALRAQALVAPRTRVDLARSLARTLHGAQAQRLVPEPTLPVRSTPVRRASRELQDLVDRLLSPGPVSARGMALVALLVNDGAGPLHYAVDVDELVAAAREARAALG